MAIAGKVAITPKGNWSASTAYQKLDLVYYNNASYVAIQPSIGVVPTNTSYWMLSLKNSGEGDFTSLKSELLTTSILEKAASIPATALGVYEYALGGSDYTGKDLPESTYTYGNATVFVRYGFKTVILWGVRGFSPVFNGYENNTGVWSGWKTVGSKEYFTSEIAKYLPLTGGQIDGALSIKVANHANNARSLSFKNYDGTTYGGVGAFSQNGVINYLYIGVGSDHYMMRNCLSITESSLKWKDKNVLHAGNYSEYALPLNGGGEVQKNSDIPFAVKNTTSDAVSCFVGYTDGKGQSNHMGFSNGKPWIDGMGEIHHNGNKPTGTYTGNGKTEVRTVNVGGIGKVLLINGAGNKVFVDSDGACGIGSNGTVKNFTSGQVNYVNGVLSIASDDSLLNSNGTVYSYTDL